VACGNDGQFRRLAATVGLPAHWLTTRHTRTNGDRVAHRDALAAPWRRGCARRRSPTGTRCCARRGCRPAPVGDHRQRVPARGDLGLEPTYAARPGHVARSATRCAFRGHDPGPGMPPPRLGEHDALVRGWLTGSPRSLAGLALKLTEC
jgi:crotonobetainyl-CoA:carnitine CoA-transferase CaiB-like acyl-CoA transferase